MRHALLLAVGFHAFTGAAAAQDTLVLSGGRLFDGVRDELVANDGLVVRGGKFAALEGSVEDLEEAGARVLEIPDDHTIFPGLFDLHAHYGVNLFGKRRVDEQVANPLLYLANGVTSTFPAGEMDPEGMRDLRIRIDRGEAVGPRIFNSGPYFGRWRRGWDDGMTAEALAAEVDHWAELGVRGFKAKGIGADHLRVLIERAHAHGLTVTGHLGSGYRGSVNPRDAIRMGIDRVEHFLGGDAFPADRHEYTSLEEFTPDTPEFDSIAALFIGNGVHFDATLSAFGYFGERDPEVYEHWVDESEFLTPFVREMLADRPARPPMGQFERIYHVKRKTLAGFRAAGGAHLVTLGTDHPSWGEFVAGFTVHRELHCLVRGGLTPAEALRAATINGARALGVGDILGTIEPGKLADAVIVDGDPLDDVRATRNVRWVIRSGQVHDAATLLEQAHGKLGPTDADDLDDW